MPGNKSQADSEVASVPIPLNTYRSQSVVSLFDSLYKHSLTVIVANVALVHPTPRLGRNTGQYPRRKWGGRRRYSEDGGREYRASHVRSERGYWTKEKLSPATHVCDHNDGQWAGRPWGCDWRSGRKGRDKQATGGRNWKRLHNDDRCLWWTAYHLRTWSCEFSFLSSLRTRTLTYLLLRWPVSFQHIMKGRHQHRHPVHDRPMT